MHFCQNRKSIVKGFLAWSLLLLASFLLVLVVVREFLGKAEAKTADSICRGSVAAREKTYWEIYDPYTGKVKLGSVASPLLCKTLDKFLPEDKDATKEQIEKDIANLMASCWERYGEGYIQDVFKEGDIVSKNCQVCYTVSFTVSLRETSKFQGEIKSVELLRYLFENPHKASAKGDYCKVNGGFCINSEKGEDCINQINADPSYLLIDKKNDICKKTAKNSCCYTEYECWNKGGICTGTNPDENQYSAYDKWDCPSKMKCYVKKEDYYSYGDYIQSFGGSGNIIIMADIKPGDTYAISFGSPTGTCTFCTYIGLGGGAAAVAAGVGGAIALGVPTLGIGSVPVLVLFGIGYFAGKGGSEFVVKNIGDLFERDINTIYLTTLNQILSGDNCRIVKDIRET